MQRKQATLVFLLALSGAALVLCYIIAQPFIEPFFVAVMIAIVLHPIHARVQARLHRPNFAALISTILVLALLIIPTIVLGITVHKEITRLYQSLREVKAGQAAWNGFFTSITDALLKWVG